MEDPLTARFARRGMTVKEGALPRGMTFKGEWDKIWIGCCPHPPYPFLRGRGGFKEDGLASPSPVLSPRGRGTLEVGEEI